MRLSPALIIAAALLTACVDTRNAYDVQEAKDAMDAVTDRYFN